MRTYEEAKECSKQNIDELIEFKALNSDRTTQQTGFFLNGEREGVFTFYRNNNVSQKDTYNSKISHGEHLRFRPNGDVRRHFFSKSSVIHGEYIWFGEDYTVSHHQFVVNCCNLKELDYLLDAERDEAFYETLALHGIDKEYTIGGV